MALPVGIAVAGRRGAFLVWRWRCGRLFGEELAGTVETRVAEGCGTVCPYTPPYP